MDIIVAYTDTSVFHFDWQRCAEVKHEHVPRKKVGIPGFEFAVIQSLLTLFDIMILTGLLCPHANSGGTLAT